MTLPQPVPVSWPGPVAGLLFGYQKEDMKHIDTHYVKCEWVC